VSAGEAVRPATPVGEAVAAPPVGLYIHVPFCVSICPYCDFVVVAGSAARGPRNRVGLFVAALRTELELRADALEAAFPDGRPPLETVYLGGGTPSLLAPEVVAGLVALVARRYGLANGAEVTLEANPGRDERGDAAAWRQAGITRLSFGAQALDTASLRRLGRRHDATDVAAAVADARAAGIRSVSLDLLYDVPDQDLATFTAGLATALEFEPDHLSLYALSLDDPDAEGLTAPLGDHLPVRAGARAWRRRAVTGQDEDRAAEAYVAATSMLAAAGYRGYEISNWARPGHESRHNLAYWRRRPVAAVGPGAHGFDGVTRRWTAARLDTYIEALDAGRLPPGGSTLIDSEEAALEGVTLGLRLDTGLPLAAAGGSPLADQLDWALASGILTVTEQDRVVLTARGRLLSNELFARLV
jgi:putative oxygen-independent coproporphyrinogen III oxidase